MRELSATCIIVNEAAREEMWYPNMFTNSFQGATLACCKAYVSI